MTQLYYYPLSPFARKVRMALEEKKLPYEQVFVNLARYEQYTRTYLQINPHGKVPTLVDGETVIHESSAIIEYLEERYPTTPPLLPEGAEERARARALEVVSDSRFSKVLGPLLLEQLVASPSAEEQTRIQLANESVRWHLEWLEEELAGREWLVGEFSVADLAFACMFGTLRGYYEVPARLGALWRWLKRLEARPTWKYASSVPMKPWRKGLLRPLRCEGCGLAPFDRPAVALERKMPARMPA